ncbi:MAG: FAD-dependent oxidoreductase [Candidatus Igneacidithiobacillus chanchocoensis]
MKMSAQSAEFIIIGAGLSGLYAAHLLTERGADWCLLEARQTAGGRILSVAAPGGACAQRFDLGPSWYWPEYQGDLARLIAQRQLETFPQYETGNMVVERSNATPPQHMPGYRSVPQSWRLAGGMAALLEGLQKNLDAERMHFGQVVQELQIVGGKVAVTTVGENGELTVWQANKVLLALPPRLAIERLHFAPALPEPLRREWSATPTWMAPHAKYLAVYEKPFWRVQGLSGEGRSAVGPLQEIHDASLPDGIGALFGFLGMPARLRRSMSAQTLQEACRRQLGRLFGASATTPVAEFFQDWAENPFTSTTLDEDAAMEHVSTPVAAPAHGPWAGKIVGIGSEWATAFPGYLAGAVESATIGVESIR